MDIDQLKKICKQYNIKPLDSRGQNFLINNEILARIIKEAKLYKDDIVLEVGPGFGILTQELAKHTKQVIAVEIDKKLSTIFKSNFQDHKNVKLIEGDILKLKDNDPKFPATDYKIISNLPYNITSIFLRKFLSNNPKPSEMIIMLQKEVAERICAQPGQMSLLAVSVQFYAQPKILFEVSKENFWPQPKVDSAIIKIITKPAVDIHQHNHQYNVFEKDFFQIVKIGFSSKRKQLQNNLSAGLQLDNQKIKLILRQLGFKDNVRAQELSVDDWVKLVNELKKHKRKLKHFTQRK
ncbi:ribosomal RNA small subunit methyltransferase A [Patescibacteria group bacterium]|nr:ribosomal RNA small subunit methyltransferase A [Patescibacteria group bacterium]